jgi:predicted nucleic acid-binding protein
MIAVDTSVLIDFLRGETTLGAERLAELEADEVPFFIPLVCYQEVLQGARTEREWKLLAEYLETQRLLVPQDPLSLHREAARIFFDGRRRGVTVRSTVDCLIAAQALQAKATLLHNDDDFERIAALRPLKTLRG